MINDFEADFDYEILNCEPDVDVQIVESSEDGSFYHLISNAKDNRSVLVLRDSFGIAMINYLAKYYADVIFVNDVYKAKEILAQQSPDIIILETVERLNSRFEDEPVILVN